MFYFVSLSSNLAIFLSECLQLRHLIKCAKNLILLPTNTFKNAFPLKFFYGLNICSTTCPTILIILYQINISAAFKQAFLFSLKSKSYLHRTKHSNKVLHTVLKTSPWNCL